MHLSNIGSSPCLAMVISVAFGQGVLLKFPGNAPQSPKFMDVPLILRICRPFGVGFGQDCRCLSAQSGARRCIWTTFIRTTPASASRCVAFGQGRFWRSTLLLQSGFPKWLPLFHACRSSPPESLPHVNVKVRSPAGGGMMRHPFLPSRSTASFSIWQSPNLSSVSKDSLALCLQERIVIAFITVGSSAPYHIRTSSSTSKTRYRTLALESALTYPAGIFCPPLFLCAG